MTIEDVRTLRHRVLRRNCDHHVHVIGQQMPFFDSTLLLHSQLAEYFSQVLPQLPYSVFLRHFGMNTTWYLHSHFVWLRLSIPPIAKLLFVCLAAHVREFLRWTPVSVKLLLPPRQSRGLSLRTS